MIRRSLAPSLAGTTLGLLCSPTLAADTPDQLRQSRTEQERWREERRDRTLMRRLGYRPLPPNGIAEHLAEGARDAVRLDRFLWAALDDERTPDRKGSEAPAHVPAAPSHSPDYAAPQRGPER